MAAGEAQAVIGHRTDERKGALDGVEAVHRIVFFDDLATLGELAAVVERVRFGLEEIGVNRDDALGLGELVNRLHVLTKSGLRGGGGGFVLGGFVFGPDSLGELLGQLGDERGAGRR